MSLKAGDVVLLKSGGPRMTIVGNHPEIPEAVVCQWFKEDEVKSDSFFKIALKEYQEPNFEDF